MHNITHTKKTYTHPERCTQPKYMAADNNANEANDDDGPGIRKVSPNEHAPRICLASIFCARALTQIIYQRWHVSVCVCVFVLMVLSANKFSFD